LPYKLELATHHTKQELQTQGSQSELGNQRKFAAYCVYQLLRKEAEKRIAICPVRKNPSAPN